MATLKMTARWVEAVPAPAEGQADHWDEDLPGFGLRVSYGGRKSWVVRYRVKGHLRRMTIGSYPRLGLADARDEAKKVLHGATLGVDAGAKKLSARRAESFSELAEQYIEKHAKPKKRSWEADQRIINVELLPHWRHLKIEDLRRGDVRDLVDGIATRGAGTLANRTLALISKMLNFARDREWVEANVASHMARPTSEHARDRVLSDDELRAIWTAVEGEALWIETYFKIRLLTAQRGQEVREMRWADLHLAGGWWTIPAESAKNGLSHRVPLSKPAVALLERLRDARKGKALKSPWVFPSRCGDGPMKYMSKLTDRIRAKGIGDFRPHDLRRTAASRMTGMGISRLVVAKILNHVERGVTAVYDRHSYDTEKRGALDAWASRLMELLRERDEVGPAVAGGGNLLQFPRR